MNAYYKGRMVTTHNVNDRGIWSDKNGHGTHVVGTALGNGVNSGADPSTNNYAGSYAGVAPKANLVFQSNANTNGTLFSTSGDFNVADFHTLYRQAYNSGARIHSNSWGAAVAGAYNADSRALDRFTWENQDMLVIFAAGNSGVDIGGNGVVDPDSIGSPGTAKNSMTVGAMENNRPAITATWGNSYGAPINTDRKADNTAGMAAFSSRGPCDDTAGPSGERRVKPDISAPGTYISSVRTSHTFLTEGFESAAVGGLPAGWTQFSTGTMWAATDEDEFSGARSMSLGTPTTSYSFSGDNILQTTSFDQREASILFVSFRAKWNLRTGDIAGVARTSDGFVLEAFSGSSGGAWVHVTLRLVRNGASSAPIWFFLSSANAAGAGPFFLLIDDVTVRPGLTDTHGRIGTETAGGAEDNLYHYSDGTSMATPAVAGSAALVRQYYQEHRNHNNPSAALLKATLMASALNTTPGQYGGGATQEIPATRPNNVQGAGRVDVQKAVAPHTNGFANTKLLFADTNSLRTGESDTYNINVTTGTPLNIALVYTDAPALTAAAVTLVNDLDLTITGPSGTFRGNGIPGDRRNNVEIIDRPSTDASGVYTITVDAFNTPAGPQPYALVVYGDATFANALRVSPSVAICQLGRSYQFEALFNGRPTPGVAWSVVAGGGSIDSSGLYTAPGSGASATVRATLGALTADATVNLVAAAGITASISVQHTQVANLSFRVGAGTNPAAPLFETALITHGLSGSGVITATGIDVSGGAAFLPPSPTQPWYARVIDSTGGNTGTIVGFFINYNGQQYDATNLTVPVPDPGTGFGWIDPTPPSVSITAPAAGSTVSGNVAFSATASDNDTVRRVEFFVDDRLIGADTSSPFSVTWPTGVETNAQHRIVARAFDASGNSADDFRLVIVDNAGARPNVNMTIGNWSFNPTTRVLTATATFNNTGSVNAHRVTLQRVTLYGTGPTFSGFLQVYMQPASGAPFPRNLGTINAGGNTTLDLSVVVPPEVTSIPRWSSSGFYFDAAVAGNMFFL
jgi:hypothetical protein